MVFIAHTHIFFHQVVHNPSQFHPNPVAKTKSSFGKMCTQNGKKHGCEGLIHAF